jgi:hypothetical protein
MLKTYKHWWSEAEKSKFVVKWRKAARCLRAIGLVLLVGRPRVYYSPVPSLSNDKSIFNVIPLNILHINSIIIKLQVQDFFFFFFN